MYTGIRPSFLKRSFVACYLLTSFKLATLLKFIYNSVKVINIYLFLGYCLFQAHLVNLPDIPVSVHESSTSFTSYTDHISSTHFAWVLQPLQFIQLPSIQ
jgi:hypoxanthine-guanine phosphoribosyltransferase